ncbi:glycosyltransferase family 9 protein [Nemorincola caseinilytica]|uniref:Glycosyltransferase family 9 protein n=1 Tax=Nemorincola caseinilytica TaxID=2054315 RepID=A0ABP8NKW0_9BACT
MKVLVIRFSSIGDIVLTTPVLRCLKEQLAHAEVHYLTKLTFSPILMHNPHIDKLWYLHSDLAPVIEELKKEKFDCIIDLHHNLRTMQVKRALKVKKCYSFPKLNIQKWLLTNLKIDLMPDKSIVDRYMETVKPLRVANDGKGLDHFLPPQKQLGNKDIPMSHWGGYVGCVIGGSMNTKKLPVDKWKEFCRLSPYPIMLLGGPEDMYEGGKIAEMDPVKIYNSCGKFNLSESAELVKMARVVVSNDTGLMHIAAAYKKPIISLWGNTSPEMGMFPYYGHNNLKERIAPELTIMENKALRCHPCSKIGYDKCPKGHFKCMNELDMTQVADRVRSSWNATAKKLVF